MREVSAGQRAPSPAGKGHRPLKFKALRSAWDSGNRHCYRSPTRSPPSANRSLALNFRGEPRGADGPSSRTECTCLGGARPSPRFVKMTKSALFTLSSVAFLYIGGVGVMKKLRSLLDPLDGPPGRAGGHSRRRRGNGPWLRLPFRKWTTTAPASPRCGLGSARSVVPS